MSLSASPVSQTSVTGVCHSTFEFLLIGRSSQSIIVGLLRFWDSLKFKKDSEFMSLDLTQETTRVIIRILYDQETNTCTPKDTKENPDRHKCDNNISTLLLLLSCENSLHVQCQNTNAIVFL
ncbi:hypothetical protein Bca101_055273 [Brassica carinata]